MKDSAERHFEGKVAQKAVIIQEGKVLLVRDPRMEYEVWELPGGRLNEGELPEVGLAREIYEELGVHIDIHEVVYLEQFWQENESKNALLIAYRVTMQDPEAPLHLNAEEIVEARFVSLAEVSKLNLFPEYGRTLESLG